MIEYISRQNIYPATIDEANEQAAEAMDRLWRTYPLRLSATGKLKTLPADFQELAERFASSDAVLVIAEKEERLAIRAVLDAVPQVADAPHILFPEISLSPRAYADWMEKWSGRTLSLIAVSIKKESLPLRAAYAIWKQFVFNEANQQKTRDRLQICNIGGEDAKMLREEAEMNGYSFIPLEREVNAASLLCTPAVLLPLLIASGKEAADAFISGFNHLVSATCWDVDAAVPAWQMSRAAYRIIETWQKEYRAMSLWAAHCAEARAFYLPQEEQDEKTYLALSSDKRTESGREKPSAAQLQENAAPAGGTAPGAVFSFLIAAEEGQDEILTPPFDGCDPDGSLQMLVNSIAAQAFFEGKSVDDTHTPATPPTDTSDAPVAPGTETPASSGETTSVTSNGFWLKLPKADASNAGALAAFLLMSAYIALHLNDV